MLPMPLTAVSGRSCREYQAKNQHIGYKKIENKGIAANTNAAAALAGGEYLALADHDDILAPHALYAMGRAILDLRAQGKPDGFVYSDEALFNKSIQPPHGGPLQAGLRAGLPALLQLHLPSGRVPAGTV